MILRVSKSDLENIILWGAEYKRMAEDTGIPFEKEENDLFEWLREQRNKVKP